MVCFIYGNDTERSHKELQKLVAQFLEKEDNPAVFRVDDETFSEPFFNDILKTGNLFSAKKIVVSKRLMTDFSTADYILENLSVFDSSPDMFLFFEESVKEDLLLRLKNNVSDVREFFLKETGKKFSPGNKKIFRITDSFGARQKEKTWLLCQEEFLSGTPPEDVFWKIVWQVKNLLAVKKGGGKGMHPFAYKKAKEAASLFEEVELKRYSDDLVDLYHESRLGKKDFLAGLERIVLKL